MRYKRSNDPSAFRESCRREMYPFCARGGLTSPKFPYDVVTARRTDEITFRGNNYREVPSDLSKEERRTLRVDASGNLSDSKLP